MTTYTVGQLFFASDWQGSDRVPKGLCILARVDVLTDHRHRMKLIHLLSGNRMSDNELLTQGTDKVPTKQFHQVFGTRWKPVAPMSELELAMWCTRQ